MKFDKFLKNVGMMGQIHERENGDRWLVCGGVGMKIPVGAVNLLGSGVATDKEKELIEEIVHSDTDTKVTLSRAILKEADGKASDIIRVFANDTTKERYLHEVGIYNGDFGLLEKADQNLAVINVEDPDDELDVTSYLLILDHTDDEVQGFITGVDI